VIARTARRIHSLRTQLTLGATFLLALTVTAVGYMLIVHQRNVLTMEIKGKVVLQGRNIALTSEKFLLRPDPEFDLFPMIQRLVGSGSPVASVVVVDNDGVVVGHQDLLEMSKVYSPKLALYRKSEDASLRSDETLYEDEDEYLFVTPVTSLDQKLGEVYLSYSKRDLHANVNKAILITLAVSLGVLLIGVTLSFVFFRHIAHPMQVLLDGVEALDGDTSQVKIDMPTRNEFAILADAFNAMSDRIDDARRAQAVRERMQRELELAREIQHSLLPGRVDSPRGYEIDHYYEAANEVGGDYVDVIPLDDDRLAIAQGDVSGKGVQGLVVMAMVKTLFQQLAPRAQDTRAIVCELNAALYGSIKSNMFVTFVTAIFDARTGALSISNAGHNPVLVYRADTDTVENIRLGGPPLGAFGALHFNDHVEEREIRLNAGDAALIYTDGVNESRNRAGELYSIPRVVDMLRACSSETAHSIVQGIVHDTAEFREGVPQSDDLTLLVLKAPTPVPSEKFEVSEVQS
jgi:serine phosphatase RsbU (regulator of sigma subunit)